VSVAERTAVRLAGSVARRYAFDEEPRMRLRYPSAAPAVVAMALALVASPARPGAEPYATVGVDAVEKMLGASDVRIYDANPRDLFEKSHLPGAIFIGHDKDLSAVLPADKSTRLVFYCSGPR
jgi:Rhodanese-like domain